MSLKVTSKERETGVFVLSLIGSLDTNTYTTLEKRVDSILEVSPKAIIFDMENLNYISSMGVRVLIKTQKALRQNNGNIMFINLQPQIKKVFEIINALPPQQVFRDMDELDKYLNGIQRKITEDNI